MRIKATPHCQYCLHEDSSIQHIIWDCPRFAELRKSWPYELNNRDNWPTCAKNAMICTTTMALAIRNEWHKFQFLVAQVLWQWMELNRNSELYQQFAPEEEASRPVNVNSLARPCKQTCDLSLATALPLQWNPPATRTEWNKWGSTCQDFPLVFSFWTRWTQKHSHDAVKVSHLDSSTGFIC